jgi:hypothetical protein
MLLETGKYKIKLTADLVCGEGPFSDSQTLPLPASSAGGRGKAALWSLL